MADRTILHSDANCFYASVEMLHRPEYRHVPMAVGGDSEARHGIVLTANYIAKRAGVKTGMALWQAKQACPEVAFVPPRMDLYLRFSRMLNEMYAEYTNLVEPYGIDEDWLDVTAEFTRDGLFLPKSFAWEDGVRYEIDRVKDVRRAASLKAGGVGQKYTCVVKGRDVHLFYEKASNATLMLA